MMESMRATLGEIRNILSQEKAASDEQKQKRRDAYEDKINQLKSDVGVRNVLRIYLLFYAKG